MCGWEATMVEGKEINDGGLGQVLEEQERRG
jgi:hypothetical protein